LLDLIGQDFKTDLVKISGKARSGRQPILAPYVKKPLVLRASLKRRKFKAVFVRMGWLGLEVNYLTHHLWLELLPVGVLVTAGISGDTSAHQVIGLSWMNLGNNGQRSQCRWCAGRSSGCSPRVERLADR